MFIFIYSLYYNLNRNLYKVYVARADPDLISYIKGEKYTDI